MKPKVVHKVLIGVVAISILGGGAGYYLMTRRLSSRVSMLGERQAELQLAEENLQQLQALADKYKGEVKDIESQITNMLPKSKMQSEIIAQIVAMAAQSGIGIDPISFNATTDLPSTTSQTEKSPLTGEVISMPMRFNAVATYPQLQEFLIRLENSARHVSVREISIASSGKGVLTLNFLVDIHLQP